MRPQIAEALVWMTDCQKWMTTNKTGPLLQSLCRQHYGTTRSFIYPAETRFGGKLLQMKRFLSMKLALQQLVQSNQYRGYEFEDDIFAPRISGEEFWDLLERVTKACGPLMLLLRLADTNKATLSKLKGTVEWMKLKLTDSGEMSVEDQISAAFHNRAPELECDVASAAYVLDPQFVRQSRQADQSVMDSFWRVSRNVLFITDDTEWRQTRQIIVSELASFRMQTGGFACEVYDNVDTCAFWGAAGCHAPTLRRLAFCLCSLPCSSGEAERN